MFFFCQVALESFNTTHTINTLTFGDQPPPGHASAKHEAASTVLEGHHKTVQDTHAMHQVQTMPRDELYIHYLFHDKKRHPCHASGATPYPISSIYLVSN